tara:strand:- start:530 stop:2677 length:2148 start_codon:yes stop_codon:yes gene_type:complete
MSASDQKEQKNTSIGESKTFPVPFNSGEITENIIIKTNSLTKSSKEQVIYQALKLHSQGNISKAANYYKYLIDQGFKDHRVFANYGIILRSLGKLKEAEILQRRAIKLTPNLAQTHYNLGNILKDVGKSEEAEKSYRKAIEIKPDYAEAHLNLGSILRNVGHLQSAEKSYRKAIEINPSFAEAYYNLGNILGDLGNLQEANISYREAINLKPDYTTAHYNLGNILSDLGNLREAEISYKEAIKLKPDFAEAICNLGNIFSYLNNYKEAINLYKKAIKIDNNLYSAQSGLIRSCSQICDWNEESIQNDWLKSIGIKGSAINPWDFFALEDNPIRHLKRAKNLYKEKFIRKEEKINSLNNKKIHIGYFSSDFRAHPTMYLISSILNLHDKSKFDIFLYSFAPKEDKYTQKAKNSGCIYRDIKELDDIKVVELAREDKLDIAIDLMGYIKNHRMSIFSYRVAPIQINYLAFPGSVGSNSIDYILADNIVIPQKNEKFYSEKILRMPYCYQCNDNTKEICKERISKEDFNLPKKGFIFTCFNNNYKITKKEFNIWMRLITKIKGSVLWLYKSNNLSMKNLKKEARKRNVDPDRLIFADELPLKKHLARHLLGDLALDTFNCNGHTTTSDALWAGLPVLTKMGESFAARVSASLLTSIGLTELITFSETEYENKALYIARNPDQLLKLKSKLSKSRETSSLYNSKLFTRNLENKFRELVE